MDATTGILTFINTINYGAELQAFALCKQLNTLGLKSEIINYSCHRIQDRETPKLPGWADIRNPKRCVGMALKYPELKRRSAAFESFRRSHTPIGRSVNGANEIINRYDNIVVGSDQVWCHSITGGDDTFFVPGDKSNCRRVISYAASFGDEDMPELFRDQTRSYLSDFDRIGLREKAATGILSSIGVTTPASINVDPTLLLDRTTWSGVAGPRVENDKYVFAYMVSESGRTREVAKRIAEKQSLRLRYIEAYGRQPFTGAENMGFSSPSDFLALIRDAEFIVTSSFHGMCFSIIFNKPFRYVIPSGNRKSRLYNLAKELGLTHLDDADVDTIRAIDYEHVNEQIEKLRRESIEYLADALLTPLA
ncbi:polysaccharide pyruvyl transferase family protein [Collinsella tanakaei]|nr:polysaccharide pyruvyl transferase family protein [Collinsella tanakaei]